MGATRERIIAAAGQLMKEGGPRAVTFDAVAARVGVSKQAVIYWFPGKAELLAGVGLPCLREEADVAIAAARSGGDRGEVIREVIHALTRHHLADLERFRMVYVAPQVGRPGPLSPGFNERVHPITASMYDAIEAALGGGPAARAEAVTIHMAAIGHALLVALTDHVQDPLRHDPAALADTLGTMLSGARP